jgi:hypothetical protein
MREEQRHQTELISFPILLPCTRKSSHRVENSDVSIEAYRVQKQNKKL